MSLDEAIGEQAQMVVATQGVPEIASLALSTPVQSAAKATNSGGASVLPPGTNLAPPVVTKGAKVGKGDN